MSTGPTTVDFYVYASHEIAVWEAMWKALRRRGVDAQFIVEPPGVNRARGSVPDGSNGWLDDKSDGAVADLMDEEMFERTTVILTNLGLPWLMESRVTADAVLTTSGIGWLGHYRGLKVRSMYGVGAVTDSYGHGAINVGVDGVLVHGPFSAHAISAYVRDDKIHQVGFPKWSVASRNDFDKAHARRELGINDDGRPIIAWLPTWAHNSSIDDFGQAIAELSTDHRVIAKPHHNNLRFERSRLAGIAQSVELLEDLPSLVPLVIAADIVVGDARSGGVTEALLADRPVVGLVPSGDVKAQHLLHGVDEAIVPCGAPGDLRAAILRAMEPERVVARQRWAQWFFGPNSGDGDERAADAIIEICRRERESSRTSVGLYDLDSSLDKLVISTEGLDAAQVVELAWPSWPGDPRLAGLLPAVAAEADMGTLVACARVVRASGHGDVCPLRSVALDDRVDPARRLSAAARGSVLFADDECTEAFFIVCSGVDADDLESCLVALLTHEPSAVPAFVSAAGAESPNREVLVELLESVGADVDEVEALLHAA